MGTAFEMISFGEKMIFECAVEPNMRSNEFVFNFFCAYIL